MRARKSKREGKNDCEKRTRNKRARERERERVCVCVRERKDTNLYPVLAGFREEGLSADIWRYNPALLFCCLITVSAVQLSALQYSLVLYSHSLHRISCTPKKKYLC